MPYAIATFREAKIDGKTFWDVCVERGRGRGKNITSVLVDGPIRGGDGILRGQYRIFSRKSPERLVDNFAETHLGGKVGYENGHQDKDPQVDWVRYPDQRRKFTRDNFTDYFGPMRR